MSVNNLQRSFSLPQANKVDTGMQQGGGGGGAFYMQQDQQDQQDQNQSPFIDAMTDMMDQPAPSYAPTFAKSPLERMLMPLKEAAARQLYFNYPKETVIESQN